MLTPILRECQNRQGSHRAQDFRFTPQDPTFEPDVVVRRLVQRRRQRRVDKVDRRAGAVKNDKTALGRLLLLSEVFAPPVRSMQSRGNAGVVRGPQS
jgi:hypothetical protein